MVWTDFTLFAMDLIGDFVFGGVTDVVLGIFGLINGREGSGYCIAVDAIVFFGSSLTSRKVTFGNDAAS